MGAVTGLEIIGSPPFSYIWTDDLGDTISYNLDIFHLPVGNYTLHITDGNNCITTFDPYTIHDAGDVLIEDVAYSSEYCDHLFSTMADISVPSRNPVSPPLPPSCRL